MKIRMPFQILLFVLLVNSVLAQDTLKSSTGQNSPELGSKTYKDENGNFISFKDFSYKMQTGQYVRSWEMQLNNGKYDATLFLVPKIEAELRERKIADSLKNKFLGSKLPDFEFQTMDGKKITSKSLAGKVVVLNFWFVGCKPCMAEIPVLNELAARYRENPNVVFLALAHDSPDRVKTFLEKTEFTYQSIPAFDYIGHLGSLEYPSQIIVNKNGTVVNFLTGGLSEDAKQAFTESIEKSLNN